VNELPLLCKATPPTSSVLLAIYSPLSISSPVSSKPVETSSKPSIPDPIPDPLTTDNAPYSSPLLLHPPKENPEEDPPDPPDPPPDPPDPPDPEEDPGETSNPSLLRPPNNFSISAMITAPLPPPLLLFNML
jgi:hypothetical protein